MIRVLDGDMRDVVPTLDRIDAVVTDPPYHLTDIGRSIQHRLNGNGTDRTRQRNYAERGFMGQEWDGGDIAFQADTWWPVFTAMKPGGFLVAFASTRGYHRMVCAIEDAGFLIHPMIGWITAQGFPKATRFEQPELAGWRYGLQALKPALEPICCAQKSFDVSPDYGIVEESAILIEALLWLCSPAKLVDQHFAPRQAGLGSQDSVRWLASVVSRALSSGPSAVTDTFNSQEAASTFLSIALLCNAILDASYSKRSMFTTETATSLTTGLKTLRFLIAAIIPENIIQAAIAVNGVWLPARGAGETSKGLASSWIATQTPSATADASTATMKAILNILASIAESSSLLPKATVESFVLRPAQIVSQMQSEGSGRIAPALSVVPSSRYMKHGIPNTAAVHAWQSHIPSTLGPGIEPICLAQKPMEGTGSQNWAKHGVGGLNIDATRIPIEDNPVYRTAGTGKARTHVYSGGWTGDAAPIATPIEGSVRHNALGRWPANVLHDGSDEVLEAFAAYGERSSGGSHVKRRGASVHCMGNANDTTHVGVADTGSAARFFFSAKADKADRADSRHPTVKPVDLMRWLVRLVCPPGGTVLDPFAGSGSTGEAAMLEGMNVILVERDPQHCADIRHRIRRWSGEDCPLFAEVAD